MNEQGDKNEEIFKDYIMDFSEAVLRDGILLKQNKTKTSTWEDLAS